MFRRVKTADLKPGNVIRSASFCQGMRERPWTGDPIRVGYDRPATWGPRHDASDPTRESANFLVTRIIRRHWDARLECFVECSCEEPFCRHQSGIKPSDNIYIVEARRLRGEEDWHGEVITFVTSATDPALTRAPIIEEVELVGKVRQQLVPLDWDGHYRLS